MQAWPCMQVLGEHLVPADGGRSVSQHWLTSLFIAHSGHDGNGGDNEEDTVASLAAQVGTSAALVGAAPGSAARRARLEEKYGDLTTPESLGAYHTLWDIDSI